MLQRILAFFLLLFSVLFMPLWVTAILALAGIIYFKVFFEAVLIFILSDLLYGIKETKNSPMLFISFFISVLVLVMIEIFKKRIRYYDNSNY
ncbi:hypothetical protein HY311_02920 [Candidatus Nomurabacteria bacterium]|nr:hypothetical protein [Candidatus Nomurabacteria bacterium]